jgi:hypothetical protein
MTKDEAMPLGWRVSYSSSISVSQSRLAMPRSQLSNLGQGLVSENTMTTHNERIDPRIHRLADDVRAKIVASAADIEQAKGKITLTMYRTQRGEYDIDLTVTK